MLKLCLGAQQKGTLVLYTVLIWDYDINLYLLRLVWEAQEPVCRFEYGSLSF